jgi:metal-responsive CopG/Arc/MetJ family transcriptional regulator
MKTVQMTLDDDLVDAVDAVVKKLHTTRSAFARKALRDAVEKARMKQLEEKHKAGYQRKPVQTGEFDVWESEQEWPE